jgi:hypothetical protein
MRKNNPSGDKLWVVHKLLMEINILWKNKQMFSVKISWGNSQIPFYLTVPCKMMAVPSG